MSEIKELESREYRLLQVSLKSAFEKLLIPLGGCVFLFIFSIVKERDLEFQVISALLCLVCIGLVGKSMFDGNQVFIKTNLHGLIFNNGEKKYSWASLQKLEHLRVQMQVMAAPHPGFELYFDNGEKKFIDQRLKNYTDFYQELYQHKIPGAEKPLYLYETDFTGAKKDMRRQYYAVYYPDKDIVVKEKGIAKYD